MSMPGQHGLKVLRVARDEGDARWVYRDKDTIKVTGEETGGTLTVVEVWFEPKAGPPPHIHHNENEAFYVLEGQVETLDDTRRFTSGPGDFVLLPQNSRHAFRNVGDDFARILLLLFPSGFEGYFQEFGSIWTPGSEPPPSDMEFATRLAEKYGMEFIEVADGVW